MKIVVMVVNDFDSVVPVSRTELLLFRQTGPMTAVLSISAHTESYFHCLSAGIVCVCVYAGLLLHAQSQQPPPLRTSIIVQINRYHSTTKPIKHHSKEHPDRIASTARRIDSTNRRVANSNIRTTDENPKISVSCGGGGHDGKSKSESLSQCVAVW